MTIGRNSLAEREDIFGTLPQGLAKLVSRRRLPDQEKGCHIMALLARLSQTVEPGENLFPSFARVSRSTFRHTRHQALVAYALGRVGSLKKRGMKIL